MHSSHYTLGYWKTHSTYGPAAPPDARWYDLGAQGPNSVFFSSGRTWYQVFWTAPKAGNAWYQLAHQYMAAKLNTLNGSSGAVLGTALADAEFLLDKWAGPKDIPKKEPDRAWALELAYMLDDFNNGYLGVPHCGESWYTGQTYR